MTDQEIRPSGLDFVFETGLKKIEGHEHLIDALDLKMSILVAFFGALISGVLVGVFTIDLSKALQLTSNATRVVLAFSLVCFVVGLSVKLFAHFSQFELHFSDSIGENVHPDLKLVHPSCEHGLAFGDRAELLVDVFEKNPDLGLGEELLGLGIEL